MAKAKATEIGAIRDLLPSRRISLMVRNLTPNTLEMSTSAVTMLAEHLTDLSGDGQRVTIERMGAIPCVKDWA